MEFLTILSEINFNKSRILALQGHLQDRALDLDSTTQICLIKTKSNVENRNSELKKQIIPFLN